ncbi:MAG: hypothetical protein KKF68_00760 [Nanoarchaeota archaeon]|nr:hypothetical protein [Nanoarchaeota archaeon]
MEEYEEGWRNDRYFLMNAGILAVFAGGMALQTGGLFTRFELLYELGQITTIGGGLSLVASLVGGKVDMDDKMKSERDRWALYRSSNK